MVEATTRNDSSLRRLFSPGNWGEPFLSLGRSFELAATKSKHRQYKHAKKGGCVTIAGKLSEDFAPVTLNSILKQAGLKGKSR